MCQDISGKEAIVKANSFHNSYARAITIHGTWGQSETLLGVQVGNTLFTDSTSFTESTSYSPFSMPQLP